MAISYRKCFSEKPSTDHSLNHAMRYAIKDQILQFRNNYDESICEMCGSERIIHNLRP
jgi:hypothetical protein